MAGEVATRSKVPVVFQVAKHCRLCFAIFERDGAVRCEAEQGTLFSFPVEGAVEAGNQFFADLDAGGGGIGEPTIADADRISLDCVDWWQGRGKWQGHGHREQYAGTKIDMIFMSLAGSRVASACPRLDLAHLL